MWLNALLLAWRSITRNWLRSSLTVLGVVIGVAAVVTMVTVGNGATLAIQNQITGLGTNSPHPRRAPARSWWPMGAIGRAASWAAPTTGH